MTGNEAFCIIHHLSSFFSDHLIAFQRRERGKKIAKNLYILNTGGQNKICNVLHLKWVQKMDK